MGSTMPLRGVETQVAVEPVGREPAATSSSDARLLEQVGRAGDDHQPSARNHGPLGQAVELDDRRVVAADDEQRRAQGRAAGPRREIRPPAARDHRRDHAGARRRDQRRRRAGARAEEPDRQAGRGLLPSQSAAATRAPAEQVDVEAQRARARDRSLFLGVSKSIEQRAEPRRAGSATDWLRGLCRPLPLPWAKATTARGRSGRPRSASRTAPSSGSRTEVSARRRVHDEQGERAMRPPHQSGSPSKTKPAQKAGSSGTMTSPAGVDTLTWPARNAAINSNCAVRSARALSAPLSHSR